MRSIVDGRSIMDTVGAEAKRLAKDVDGEDRRDWTSISHPFARWSSG